MGTFSIEVISINWITPTENNGDLCAHGHIRVMFDDVVVVDKDSSDGWTLSASALYHLRTLEKEHTKDSQVGEHLVPCCGNGLFAVNDSEDVLIVGCANGVDWEVRHKESMVELTLENGYTSTVSFNEYRKEVLSFVNTVEEFYDNHLPRVFNDDLDKKGYEQFWKEWHRRVNNA